MPDAMISIIWEKKKSYPQTDIYQWKYEGFNTTVIVLGVVVTIVIIRPNKWAGDNGIVPWMPDTATAMQKKKKNLVHSTVGRQTMIMLDETV